MFVIRELRDSPEREFIDVDFATSNLDIILMKLRSRQQGIPRSVRMIVHMAETGLAVPFEHTMLHHLMRNLAGHHKVYYADVIILVDWNGKRQRYLKNRFGPIS